MNIAERYLKGVSWGARDTQVKLSGKAVYGLQTAFLTDWYAVDRSLITSAEYFPAIPSRGETITRLLRQDPVENGKISCKD